MLHHIRIRDRPFHDICSGKKTIEVRIFKSFFKQLQKNDTIIFHCKKKKVKTKIKLIRFYSTFQTLLYHEDYTKLNPRFTSLLEAIYFYTQLYSKDNRKTHTKMAIHIYLC